MRLVYISNLWDPSVPWISNYLMPRVFRRKPPSRLREPQRPKLKHDAPHAGPELHHHVYGHDAIPRIVIVQATTHIHLICFFLFFFNVQETSKSKCSQCWISPRSPFCTISGAFSGASLAGNFINSCSQILRSPRASTSGSHLIRYRVNPV